MSPRPGTQSLQKRERGKKKNARRYLEHEEIITSALVCFSVTTHTHDRGFLMFERLRKYGQVFARKGSQLEMTRDTWRRPKVFQVHTQRGHDVWRLFFFCTMREEEKEKSLFARKTAEREDSVVCLFSLLLFFFFFFFNKGTIEHFWSLNASSHPWEFKR